MTRERTQVTSTLLQLAGFWFIACAILYNPLSVNFVLRTARAFLGKTTTTMPSASYVLRMQVVFLVIGLLYLLVRAGIDRSKPLARFARKPITEKVVLAFLAIAIPVTSLEVGLRPLAGDLGRRTSLFVRDNELGWRLRPSTRQMWGGYEVSINAHGWRGPLVPWERTPGMWRLLWLGDSVTFGYKVGSEADVFPWIVARRLGERGHPAETINAGVGGYSPWQERILLEREGLRYHPDLVVLGFVLNDVTEKFDLVRYGGRADGRQLRDSYSSRLDRVLAHSAIASRVRRMTREYKARRRLGEDTQLGAIRQQELDVGTLLRNPEQENVQIAWDMTKENLDAIARTCRDNDTRLLVIVFPFSVQLVEDVRAPQDVMVQWAQRNDVDLIDLLPVLAATGMPAEELFLDEDHLSPAGHHVVADTLSQWILQKLE